MLSQQVLDAQRLYANNPNLIAPPVGSNLPMPNKVMELEAKFGRYTKNGFDSNVPFVHFDRLHTTLKQIPGLPEVIEESTVSIFNDGIRRIVTPIQTSWQRKKKEGDFEDTDHNIRISISTEETLPQEPPNFTPVNIRERMRHSFTMGNVRIDLTEVMMRGPDKLLKQSYEVELEYIGGVNNFNTFEPTIIRIFKYLRGTQLFYTNKEKDDLIRDVSKLIGGHDDPEEGKNINRNILVQARNVKKRDLVSGGIVNNNKIDENVRSKPEKGGIVRTGTRYLITFKADGVRKMLIIHTTGIWLIYPPYEYNLIFSPITNPGLKKLLEAWNGTILDGELVTPKTQMNIQYWYLAFDCIADRNSTAIQSSSYLKRQSILVALSEVIKNPTLTIDTKENKEITSPNDFFQLVREFLNKRNTLNYQEDGLMFVPIDAIYNPKSEKLPLHTRSLTKHPDTVKWKESTDITIDFAIRWLDPLNNRIELQSYDSDTKRMVPFVGSDINPVTPDMIDSANPLTLNKPSGLIVEYEWVKLGNTGIFQPRRIRSDKKTANSLAVALDDWEDIQNPITSEDISGISPTLTFAYHNRVKRSLYDMIPSGASILDIGSGRGGDVSKWKDSRVVAVEPNDENRFELMNRINTFGMNNNVAVVATGGEDTQTITENVQQFIPGGKVDVVTLMLSMSFFWASDAHLESLVNTIINNLKPGGMIIFLTIDGDVIEQIFQSEITTKQIGSATVYLYPPSQLGFGRAVDFSLPNTIVGDQREYIVHIDDFTLRLQRYGIYLNEIHRAEGEKLLTQEEQLYSSMYSFGYYVNTDKSLLEGHPKIPTNIALPIIPIQIKFPLQEIYQPVSPVIMKPVSPVIMKPVSPVIMKLVSPVIMKPVSPVIKPLIPIKKKVTHYEVERNQLRWLSVSYTGNNGKILDGPAVNDDTYAPLTCTWYKDLVRIATIGDGSCFIHAVLKGYYSKYQENSDAIYRLTTAAYMRKDLALALNFETVAYPGYNYWLTSGRGAFPRMVMQQINDENSIGLFRVDFSLSGLQRLFNSTSQLGDEVYTFVSDILNIDIYILRATKDDVYPHLHTKRPGNDRQGIVIIGNEVHYEVLAVNTEDGFQTIFGPNDPFIVALTDIFIGDGDFNDIMNAIPYNPDATFIHDFVEAFTNENGLVIPKSIEEIFAETDPFRVTLNRLLPQIKEASVYRAAVFQPQGQILGEQPVLSPQIKEEAVFQPPKQISGEHPVLVELDALLNKLIDKGLSLEDYRDIRETVFLRLKPEIPQDLDSILASAETDGLISSENINAIRAVKEAF